MDPIQIAENLTVAQRQALLDWPQDSKTERALLEKGLDKYDRPITNDRS